MITPLVLVALALLDGAFAGFRASVGRTGLVRHVTADRRASVRGALLGAGLLLPAAVVWKVAIRSEADRPDDLRRACDIVLAVLSPYAAVVLLALAAYAVLGWRQKYLASALILGPFTLLRPAAAALAAGYGVWRSDSAAVVAVIALGTVAVLAVEPLAGRLWYADTALGRRPARV